MALKRDTMRLRNSKRKLPTNHCAVFNSFLLSWLEWRLGSRRIPKKRWWDAADVYSTCTKTTSYRSNRIQLLLSR